MTWTIYNNDKAWGFLSRAEQREIYDHNGVLIEYDYAYGVWRVIDHHAIPRDKKLYRAASERKPAVDADQTAQLDTANARIAELEAEIVKSRSDVERVKADIFAETYERENPSEAKNSLNEAFLEWWNVTFDWSFFQGKGLFENHAERAFKAGWEAAKPPTTQSTEYTRTDIANARIAELEAEIVTARADALRDVQRIKADRDQGMLDYCALMERYDAAIENQTTEEAPCSQRS
jgi:hypothetical protein